MRYDLLVDASSLFARAFFAVKGVRAADAAFHSLTGLTRHHRLPATPTHLLCAWDAYGEAKHDKQRGPKPEGWHESRFETMDRIEETYGKVNVEVGEADDVVATAAYACEREEVRCVVASGDKDLSQLQSTLIDFFYLGDKRILTRAEICKKWQIHRPSHLAIVLALVGDSVDKISGVPGCGPKKAARIMECVAPGMNLSAAYEQVRLALSDQSNYKDVPSDRDEFERCFSLTCLFDAKKRWRAQPIPSSPLDDDFGDYGDDGDVGA